MKKSILNFCNGFLILRLAIALLPVLLLILPSVISTVDASKHRPALKRMPATSLSEQSGELYSSAGNGEGIKGLVRQLDEQAAAGVRDISLKPIGATLNN